jgi:hypothetical protein
MRIEIRDRLNHFMLITKVRKKGKMHFPLANFFLVGHHLERSLILVQYFASTEWGKVVTSYKRSDAV